MNENLSASASILSAKVTLLLKENTAWGGIEILKINNDKKKIESSKQGLNYSIILIPSIACKNNSRRKTPVSRILLYGCPKII